jgi:beta-lactamase superfamily II metal-dependent hydrolase
MLAWYYLVVLPIGSGWIFKTKFKWQAWSALVVASAALVVDWNITRQTTLIAAIPTGGGSVVYIDKPRLLLDCGNDFFAGRVTAPFLQAEGLNRLPRFCLTSDHLQQIGGAQVIRTSFTVGRIDALGEVHSGNDVEGWTVLHPNDGERHARSDDDALVLRKEFGNRAVLLLSRLGRVGQDCLLQRHTNLRSDIVIASLPEKDEPLSEPLLDAIKPKMVIIVDSETPATRRASPALRNRLGRCGARVLYCRDAGALTVAIRGSTLWITDATGEVLLTTIH